MRRFICFIIALALVTLFMANMAIAQPDVGTNIDLVYTSDSAPDLASSARTAPMPSIEINIKAPDGQSMIVNIASKIANTSVVGAEQLLMRSSNSDSTKVIDYTNATCGGGMIASGTSGSQPLLC